MIYQVAVPIYRTVNPETAFLEEHKFGNSDNPEHPNNVIANFAQEAITELNKYLTDGYAIIDTFTSENRTTTYRTYVLHKAEITPKRENFWAEINLATNIEKCETFSKSTNQTFNFWRLGLIGGDKVNVFNHPDSERNTFKLAQIAGWGDLWDEIELGVKYWLKSPIPVSTVKDGEWFKLTQIYPFVEWSTVSEWILTPDNELE
jgi:hypothetical protein